METMLANRREAGTVLAKALAKYVGRSDVVVLALPRGGVPVGYEVARALGAPLDVFVVRKLGVPGHRELAMGAIASGGARVLNREVIAWYGVKPSAIEATAAEELAELERRERLYRKDREPAPISQHTIILVDDGLATGATMKAAVAALRARRPARIVVAVPVGSPASCAQLRAVADEVVCAREPEDFAAVGQFYADFEQTSDAEVRELLESPEPALLHLAGR
jgi:predicted phosphoribosyltransferase